jgi:hypothetical protein
MNRKHCVLIVLAGSICLPLTTALRAQNTTTAGGTGGTSYTLKCPEGQVLTGLGANYGGWVDTMMAFCRTVDVSTGLTVEASETTTQRTGKIHFGSDYHWYKCPSGFAVKSFAGRAGWYVNLIEATCRKLGTSGRTQSESKDLDYLGNFGGEPYSTRSCGEAKPAIGVYGKSGEYIDSFGLICGYIMPSMPGLTAPSNGSDVTTRRPTFDWDKADRITKPYRICLNLSSDAKCSISGTITAAINAPTTQWTPATDLLFTRGDQVFWRIEACNDNGCKSTIRKFRFMP